MVVKLALQNSTSNNNTKCNLFKIRDNLALVASWVAEVALVVKQAEETASEKLQIEINICVKNEEKFNLTRKFCFLLDYDYCPVLGRSIKMVYRKN